jgi:hypothetical protein
MRASASGGGRGAEKGPSAEALTRYADYADRNIFRTLRLAGPRFLIRQGCPDYRSESVQN